MLGVYLKKIEQQFVRQFLFNDSDEDLCTSLFGGISQLLLRNSVSDCFYFVVICDIPVPNTFSIFYCNEILVMDSQVKTENCRPSWEQALPSVCENDIDTILSVKSEPFEMETVVNCVKNEREIKSFPYEEYIQRDENYDKTSIVSGETFKIDNTEKMYRLSSSVKKETDNKSSYIDINSNIMKRFDLFPKLLSDDDEDWSESSDSSCSDIDSERKKRKREDFEDDDTDIEEKFKCDWCHKSFKFRCDFNIHKRRHTKDRPFGCVLCEKSFSRPDALKRHVRHFHSDERTHQCNDCNRTFQTSGHLRAHIRLHTNENSFNCSQCDKTFRESSDLTVHLRTHTVIKPYVCNTCNATFTQINHLKIHLRTHTGEKQQFSCNECGKCFINSNLLMQHKRAIHSREKTFVCKFCNKSLSTSGSLNRHLKTHTRSLEKVIDICNLTSAANKANIEKKTVIQPL